GSRNGSTSAGQPGAGEDPWRFPADVADPQSRGRRAGRPCSHRNGRRCRQRNNYYNRNLAAAHSSSGTLTEPYQRALKPVLSKSSDRSPGLRLPLEVLLTELTQWHPPAGKRGIPLLAANGGLPPSTRVRRDDRQP